MQPLECAVDMDDEIKIALEIEVADAAAEAARDYAPDAITEENAPGGPAL